jgi:hypothetical protein
MTECIVGATTPYASDRLGISEKPDLALTRVIILGAGKFGRRAARLLRQALPLLELIVVDQHLAPLEEVRRQDPAAHLVAADGPAWAAAALPRLHPGDYLLPCLPGQVAFELLRQTVLAPPEWQAVPVPPELEAVAPVAFRGAAGELYLSRAAHLCPEDCGEPEVCPVDGLPRRPGLDEVLAGFCLPGWQIRVLSSRLLLPGVGGFTVSALRRLAEVPPPLPSRLLLATACRCHGVVHAVVRHGGPGE